MRSGLLDYMVDAFLGLVLGFLTGIMFYITVMDPSWFKAGVTGVALYVTCYNLITAIER